MNRYLKVGLIVILLIAVVAAVGLVQLRQNLTEYHHHELNVTAPTELLLSRGTSFREFFLQLEQRGIVTDFWKLRLLVRLKPELGKIRSGLYEIKPGDTLEQLLTKLTKGMEKTFSITLIEGLTIKEWLAQLEKAPHLEMSDKPFIGALLQHEDTSGLPEGKFFPNTYHYRAQQNVQALLSQSYIDMQQNLAQVWSKRDKNLPIDSPYELLILASIIEKETGKASERPLIAGVFINRLRKKMRLQTDPTVIYGMGESFKGNITRKDLRAPTPYNTYTMHGLPPTPIATPSLASLKAAAHPATTKALYFVSRNDGSHVFSDTLRQHNKAVNYYQRNKK